VSVSSITTALVNVEIKGRKSTYLIKYLVFGWKRHFTQI